MSDPAISYQPVDVSWKARIAVFSQWGEAAARHLHFNEDGFCIAALRSEQLAGYISMRWIPLPAPLASSFEAFIDILEVHQDFRRCGIASALIEISSARASDKGAIQLRSWSSVDKHEAILMWKALGFSLYPATAYPKGQEVKGFFVTKRLGQGVSN